MRYTISATINHPDGTEQSDEYADGEEGQVGSTIRMVLHSHLTASSFVFTVCPIRDNLE